MKNISSVKSYINKIKSKSRENDISVIRYLKADLSKRFRAKSLKKIKCTSSDGTDYEYRHVFIHSLVLDPEKAFSPTLDEAHNFDAWFTTKDEFNAFLNEIYKQGYMLIRPRELFGRSFQLPNGKKPLVLSFDDMNYYDYMKGFGFPTRIELDKNGNIMYLIEKCGKHEYISDGDSIGVLEEFIKKHPDFSYNGARGIIALTGYEGALGYRDTTDPKLAAVVEKIKELGYEFASHSWGHHHRIYNDENPHGPKGIADIEKWLAGVGKAIGKTDIFITPFGVSILNNPILLSHLKKKGFKYFFSAGTECNVYKENNCYYAGRFNLCGLYMRNIYEFYNLTHCKSDAIYDMRRPIPLVHKKDNISFVDYAKYCLTIPTIYVWGSIGEPMTPTTLKTLERQFHDHQPHEKWLELHKIADEKIRCFDCCGLLKYFAMGGFNHYHFNPKLDVNTEAMIEKANKKGDIDSIPEIPGVCLYMEGHVGIYIGNGEVIESTSNPKFGNGVCKTKLTDRPWEKWFFYNEITYNEE